MKREFLKKYDPIRDVGLADFVCSGSMTGNRLNVLSEQKSDTRDFTTLEFLFAKDADIREATRG